MPCARRRRARRRSPRRPCAPASCWPARARGTCTCWPRAGRSSSPRSRAGRSPGASSLRGRLFSQTRERLLRDDEPGVADHVGDADGVGVQDRHVTQVPERLDRGLLAVGEHHQHAAVALERGDRRGGGLRGRGVERAGIDSGDRAALGVHRQRGAERAPPCLAVHLDRVAARPRAEGHAATGALRRRERAHARPSGALLAPGLRAGHADLAARLRGRRAAPLRRQLRAHGLVHERAVEALAEDGVVKSERAGALADVLGGGGHQASLLISTTEPLAPGTEPRTSSRLSRMSTTSSPRWVARRLPIWPGPRMPLNTRAGSAEAPIEPGARTLCEPCETGPRWKLCRLIVPAKPLPIPIPATLTRSPRSNVSTVTCSPGVSSVVPRNSTSFRCGPASPSWPRRGFVTLRSATWSNASWTAS